MMMPTISDWRDLPFREIWVVDYRILSRPRARQRRQRRRPNYAALPRCVSKCERAGSSAYGRMSSARSRRTGSTPAPCSSAIWPAPSSASTSRRAGGSRPALSMPMSSFATTSTTARSRAADREKGFYSLGGALRYFCEDEIDTAHKNEMRDRIMQGPPFTADERAAILTYCEDDVRALARLVRAYRADYPLAAARHGARNFMWATAQQERRGVPLDLPLLERIRERWDASRSDLVTEKDAASGSTRSRTASRIGARQRFADYVRAQSHDWPTYADGSLDERDQTFRDMAGRYPQIETLRELRYSLSKLRLNDLSVGSDGSNRCAARAVRHQDRAQCSSNSRSSCFGPAKWIRFLITPPPGRAAAFTAITCSRRCGSPRCCPATTRCWKPAKAATCISGSPGNSALCRRKHVGGRAREAVRTLFKTVVLGIQYGLGPRSLAVRTGISMFEAC